MDPHIDAEPEYYWIRVDDDGEWEPALKYRDGWERCGSDISVSPFSSAKVIEVGPRIPTPSKMTAVIAAEREACARIAEQSAGHTYEANVGRVSASIASKIRARG